MENEPRESGISTERNTFSNGNCKIGNNIFLVLNTRTHTTYKMRLFIFVVSYFFFCFLCLCLYLYLLVSFSVHSIAFLLFSFQLFGCFSSIFCFSLSRLFRSFSLYSLNSFTVVLSFRLISSSLFQCSWSCAFISWFLLCHVASLERDCPYIIPLYTI